MFICAVLDTEPYNPPLGLLPLFFSFKKFNEKIMVIIPVMVIMVIIIVSL